MVLTWEPALDANKVTLEKPNGDGLFNYGPAFRRLLYPHMSVFQAYIGGRVPQLTGTERRGAVATPVVSFEYLTPMLCRKALGLTRNSAGQSRQGGAQLAAMKYMVKSPAGCRSARWAPTILSFQQPEARMVSGG